MSSDERLAKRAAAGDLGAFEAIFRRYQDDLFRFCVGILREPQDAQDAVQNTMVKAMRALPGEHRQMQLKPWLYRIAHNEAIELRRRERPTETLSATLDDAGAGTEERAEDKRRLRLLLADIADLPERQRATLVMRELNGFGFGEIGAALGTSPGAARQALYEARRGLVEMDGGREMTCDIATRMVSDADGRPRDRGLRAHLRDCAGCRRFQTEIGGRRRALASISPMPALAVAGALKSALGALGGGGGAAAGGVGAGAGAGVAAGSLGASALLKPAVGLMAVAVLGTAAVDHGALFHGRPNDETIRERGVGPIRPSATARAVGGGRSVVAAGPNAVSRRTGARSNASRMGGIGRPQGPAESPHDVARAADVTPPPPPIATAPPGTGPAAPTEHGAQRVDAAAVTTPATAPAAEPDRGGVAPDHPAHPADSDHPTHPADPEQPTPPAHPEHPAHPTHPAHPEHPTHSEAPSTEAIAGEASAAPPEPAPAPHLPPGQGKKEEGAVEPVGSEAAAAAGEESAAAKVPPGQAKKEAQAPAE